MARNAGYYASTKDSLVSGSGDLLDILWNRQRMGIPMSERMLQHIGLLIEDTGNVPSFEKCRLRVVDTLLHAACRSVADIAACP